MGSIGHPLDSQRKDGVGHHRRKPQFFFVAETGCPKWSAWEKRIELLPVHDCWDVAGGGYVWIAAASEPFRLGFGREDGQRGDRCKQSSEKCSIVGKHCF